MKVQTHRNEGTIASSGNVLEVVHKGLTYGETTYILKPLSKKHLQSKFMKVSGKGLTVTFKKKDLATPFSKMINVKKNQENSDYMTGFSFVVFKK